MIGFAELADAIQKNNAVTPRFGAWQRVGSRRRRSVADSHNNQTIGLNLG